MKKLVVMVSAYNSGEWIENRLNNLFQSTIIRDTEVWVVNANSPDERDHSIPRKFPVQYVKLPTRIGVYAAWNYIIHNSKSLYLTNANTDDIVAPNCYEELITTLESSPSCGFAYPSWYITDRPNKTWAEIQSGKVPVDPSGCPGTYHGDLGKSGVGHFPLWRRSLHERFGLFDENFKALGDADWWARCYYRGNVQFNWHRQLLACYLWRNGENLWHKAINTDEWDRYHKNVESYKG